MTNYININESVDVDIDLRDYIDEIVEFISDNDKIKQKLKINKIIPSLERKENIKKNNPFKLTNDEFELHLSYTCKDNTRSYLKNHLLIKDNKVIGIATTDGYVLIITSDEENIINLIKNKEVSLKTFCLSDNLSIKKEVELDLIDGNIFQHVSIRDDFSINNQVINQDSFNIENINKVVPDLKDKNLKPLQNDYKIEEGSRYNLVYIDNKKFNATYYNDVKKLSTINDSFNYFLDEKLTLKNKRNFVIIMPIN